MKIVRFILRYPKAVNITAWSVVASVIGIVWSHSIAPQTSSTSDTEPSSKPLAQVQQGQPEKGTPKFDTVLPDGSTIEKYGGWTRVSPPQADPVFAYKDQIAGTPVIVSQQPLPKEFADQPDQQVKQLAQSYLAVEQVKVGDVTVYIGTSGKGPQSAIFVKNRLLVLVKASARLTAQQWSDYVNTLQ